MKIVILGAGTAGITVAAQLRRRGHRPTIIDPSRYHEYQPARTLVGAGLTPHATHVRKTVDVIPDVPWLPVAATGIQPHLKVVHTSQGDVPYDQLVIATGITLARQQVSGMWVGLNNANSGVVSNYHIPTNTWDATKRTTNGSAVFVLPDGAVKCGGAGLKAAYLAADRWQQYQREVDVHLIVPGNNLFGIPAYAEVLERVARARGVTVHTSTSLSSIDPARRRVALRLGNGRALDMKYEMLHVVPKMEAPTWLRAVPGLCNSDGYVDVDAHTLQHNVWPSIYALGDVAGSPNGKTGAAVRKQAPVVVARLLGTQTKLYHGYSCCPVTTGLDGVLLAEFDYNGQVRHHPGRPRIIRDPGHRMIKLAALPTMYWRGMLRGLC